MKRIITNRPLIMGSGMGLMMLWMAHKQMTGASALQGAALVSFVGAHLVLVVIIAGSAIFASRLHPRLQKLAAKLHRPSWRHLRDMGLGMGITAILAHLFLHGGL